MIKLCIYWVAVAMMAINFSVAMNGFDLPRALLWVVCGLYLVWRMANISLDIV
jgi:hypothetical protein